MTGKRLLLLVVGLLGAFALAAAGCGGGDESTGGGSTGGGVTGGGGEAANQSMTIGWGAEPPSLDPGAQASTDVQRACAPLLARNTAAPRMAEIAMPQDISQPTNSTA